MRHHKDIIMSGKFTLEGKNAEIALKMLKDVTDLLDKNQIDYWLEGGTLLGVVRENRLLPWDNDLDLSVKEDEWLKVKKVLKQIRYRLKNKLRYRVRVRRFKKDNPPFKEGVARLIKISNRHLYFGCGEVTLDIFIKFKKDSDYFWQAGTKKKSVPSYFYDKTITYDFYNKKMRVPEKYPEYLTCRYGDWKMPVKEWNTFTDDKAINGDV